MDRGGDRWTGGDRCGQAGLVGNPRREKERKQSLNRPESEREKEVVIIVIMIVITNRRTRKKKMMMMMRRTCSVVRACRVRLQALAVMVREPSLGWGPPA